MQNGSFHAYEYDITELMMHACVHHFSDAADDEEAGADFNQLIQCLDDHMF